jgi:hypothetical protein
MKSSLGFVANKNAKLNGVRIYYFTEWFCPSDCKSKGQNRECCSYSFQKKNLLFNIFAAIKYLKFNNMNTSIRSF